MKRCFAATDTSEVQRDLKQLQGPQSGSHSSLLPDPLGVFQAKTYLKTTESGNTGARPTSWGWEVWFSVRKPVWTNSIRRTCSAEVTPEQRDKLRVFMCFHWKGLNIQRQTTWINTRLICFFNSNVILCAITVFIYISFSIGPFLSPHLSHFYFVASPFLTVLIFKYKFEVAILSFGFCTLGCWLAVLQWQSREKAG